MLTQRKNRTHDVFMRSAATATHVARGRHPTTASRLAAACRWGKRALCALLIPRKNLTMGSQEPRIVQELKNRESRSKNSRSRALRGQATILHPGASLVVGPGLIALLSIVGACSRGSSDESETKKVNTQRIASELGPEILLAASRCTDCKVLHWARLNLPETAVNAGSGKLLGPDGRSVFTITVREDDGKYTTVDENTLLAAEKHAVLARYGKFSKGLVSKLSTMSDSDRIWITIWGAVPVSYPAKETLLTDDATKVAYEAEVQASLTAASSAILRELAKHGARVVQDGSSSPLIRANVAAGSINQLANVPQIAWIGTDDWPGYPTTTAWYNAVQSDLAHYAFGGGLNERICNKEGERPDTTAQLSIAGYANPSGATHWHIRWTTGIMRSTNNPVDSIANQASTYIADWDGYVGNVDAWCANTVFGRYINFSHSFSDGSPGGESAEDWHKDWLAKHSPYPLFVASSGNYGNWANHDTVVNRHYNGLVVGGVDDRGTTGRGDDIVWTDASWRNPTSAHGDNEMPHVVAPAVSITAVGITGDGTSAASPIVTAIAALAGARDSTFNSWPEMKRAVILATSTWRMNAGALPKLSTGTDMAAGAGMADAFQAGALATPSYYHAPGSAADSRGRYATSVNFPGSFGTGGYYNGTWDVHVDVTGRLRVTLTWDATAAGCDADGMNCTGSTLDADLDLEVWNSAMTILKCSSITFDSPWELCDFNVTAGENYRIKVRQASYNASSTYMGVAWFNFN